MPIRRDKIGRFASGTGNVSIGGVTGGTLKVVPYKGGTMTFRETVSNLGETKLKLVSSKINWNMYKKSKGKVV